MAEDKLMFPIGFDLDKAVKDAGGEWKNKYAAELEKAIKSTKVAVGVKFDIKDADALDKVKDRLQKLKIEPITPETKQAIRDLARELQTLAKALEKIQKINATNASASSPDAVRAARINEINQRSAARVATEHERARAAAARAEAAELRLAQARQRSLGSIRSQSAEYGNQLGYIDRLIRRMAVLWSISAATNFVSKLREVTAEFELQRVSLGAIIQDQSRANQLFSEIKTFALQSPLTIMDLTKYTKQLAAYKIGVDELFDTTKRLADVSVGLGVSFDRIVLAYGQIRAAGALRASEIRQLTEAGIPIVEALSEKLSEVNGKLVSASDVMGMVEKRMISFEQVKEIFEDMTSAGGMFYNMQEKQSQTLFGMWSKLGDAAAVMYDEMGNVGFVNDAMKGFIKTIETLLRNWTLVAKEIGIVGASLAVYYIQMKNAAVAAKALTASEAARLAITNKQVILTPKLVAALIGQNAATKLSTALTNAHTAAVYKQATATTFLSRAMWGLTASMLANPWLIAGTAIAAVGYAIWHLKGRAETTTERIESLSRSVASLKNTKDSVDPLIKSYNELINKADKTAKEQKKLAAVTQELANRYPGAVSAVRQFGGEIELVSEKLNKLYEAEKKAREETTRYELGETEKKIKDAEDRIARLQSQLQQGTKTVSYTTTAGTSYTQEVGLSDEDKKKILEQINEIRTGKKDGSGSEGLVGLQNAAKAAKIALGLIPTEAAENIEKFGAWKKELQGFYEVFEKRKLKVFDDNQINQLSSLEDALKKTAEEYKKNIALVKTYDEVLKSKDLTEESRARIELDRAEADKMANLAKRILEHYNALSLLDEKKSGRTGSDTRLQTLNEIEKSLTEINKKYDELSKKEGATKALEHTNELYKEQLKYLNQIAKRFGLEFKMPTDFADLQKYREQILKVIEKLKASGLKGAEKAALELQMTIGTGNLDKAQKQIEAQLKLLQDRVSRTKTAKEFYDRILNLTGDYEMSAEITMSVYGDTGETLQKDMADHLREMFGSFEVEVPVEIIGDDDRIDYLALRKYVDENREALGEMAKELDKVAEDGLKNSEKQWDLWLKDLEKAKDYADKRIDLARYTAKQIADIEASGMSQERKDELIKGYRERESKEAAKLDYEQIKEQIGMFDDLGVTIGSAFEHILSELKKYTQSSEFSRLGLDAKKNVYEQINKLEERISYGFKNIGVGAVSDYVREYSTAASEYLSAQKNLRDATYKAIEADKEWERVKSSNDEAAKEAVLAEKQLAESRVQSAAAALREAGSNLQRTQNNAARASEKFNINLKKVESSINSLNNGALKALWDLIGDKGKRSVGEFLSGSIKIINALEKLTKALGESGSDMGKFSKTIASNLADAIKNIDPDDMEAVSEAAVQSLKTTLSSVIGDKDIVDLLAGTLEKNIGEIASQVLSGVLSTEDAATKVGALIDGIADAASETGEMWGAIISLILSLLDEFAQNGLGKFLGDLLEQIADAVEGILSQLITDTIPKILEGVGKVVKGVFAGLADLLTFGVFDVTGTRRIQAANDTIEEQKKLLEELEYSYKRLQKSQESALGNEYISNYNQQLKNLQAQAEAYQKQYEAEKSKGKKADEDAMKDFANSYRDTMDEIADMQKDLQNYFAGTDITSAARDFAKAWLDAKVSFEDTTEAMREKFADLIQNMIVEAMAAEVMKRALEPFYQALDNAVDNGVFDIDEVVKAAEVAYNSIGTANNAMEVLLNTLEAKGLNVAEVLGKADTQLTGISRDIATASEESINGLAQGITTQNFYISGIYGYMGTIVQIMTNGYTPAITAGEISLTDLVTMQNQHLSNLPQIANNTAEMVAECRRAANTCETIATQLGRVISPKGSTTTHTLKTSIS